MSASATGEEREATELLDETQRLRQKRDLLTKENEQLKTYLRLRQMESTATCEQLKSEIEQQIEQFEALGDQSFSDSQTSHLETLKSFRAEIEAIQCWNAKIRNKYFSRNATEEGARNLANQLTDELIEQMVTSSSVRTSDSQQANKECDNEANVAIADNKSETTDEHKLKKHSSIHKEATIEAKDSKIGSEEAIRDRDSNSNDNIKTRLRSKQMSFDSTRDGKRKRITKKEDHSSQKTSKRKRK